MCERDSGCGDDFGPGEFRGGPPPRRDRGQAPDRGDCPECAAQRESHPECAGERTLQGEDHLDHTARLWEEAFWQALHEVRVDLIKEKLRASWGKNMKGVAAVVVETMRKEWDEFQKEEAKSKKTSNPIKETIKKSLKKGPQ